MTVVPGTEGAMKLFKVLGFASLLAAMIAFAAPASAFTSGGWEGQANHDEDGTFRDCTMTADYANGITLAFDKLAPIHGIAKVVDAHGILVPLENADPVVEAMHHGHSLAVVTPAGEVSFKLSGTRDAIAALASCVSENLAAEKAGSIEAKAPKDSEDSGNKLFTPSEAAAFASDLLASAGITNYEMEDPQETPMPSFDVVWKYANGIVAALVGYKDMGAADLDEAANEVMVEDAKNCKGTFASGKKISEPADQVSVKRLYTSCRSTGKSVEIHYTLVETGSGHLILIAHLNLGEATGDVANADGAFLHGAVLRSFK